MIETVALLVRVEDAAAALGVGRTTVYQLVADGELESVRIGRARRIPTASLAEYVDRLRAGARDGDEPEGEGPGTPASARPRELRGAHPRASAT